MSVLVLAEIGTQDVSRGTRQAVVAAQSWGLPVDVLVPAGAPLEAHAALSGVRKVLGFAEAEESVLPAEDLATLIEALADSYQVVISSHHSLARNVLPRLAARRDVGMVTDVLSITGPHQYSRPAFAGNLIATVDNLPGLQVLTVRGSRFAEAPLDGAAEVLRVPLPPCSGRTRFVGRHIESGRPSLKTARVVVSGGRALGSAEKFNELLAPLADCLGAALGATRAAVDAGYAPNEWQVGQTGTLVSPELYIAVGISGAAQHLSGIRDSRVIVAINQDAEAPIMKLADFSLQDDLFVALPALLRGLA